MATVNDVNVAIRKVFSTAIPNLQKEIFDIALFTFDLEPYDIISPSVATAIVLTLSDNGSDDDRAMRVLDLQPVNVSTLEGILLDAIKNEVTF